MPVGTIVIVDYDPRWPAQYEAEAGRLRKALGPQLVALEHCGSTAVPGLAAKPVIDLIGALRDLGKTAACIEPLRRLGYTYVPEYEAEMPERRYFRKGPQSARTHHLHLYAPEEFRRRPQLLFRDYLRAHPDVAAEYARLKRDLALRFGGDRVGYTDAKTAFIRSVVDQARAVPIAGARHDERDRLA